MPKSDAKVFEVKIRVFDFDPLLKPAMTTSNTIVTGYYNDKLIIPSDVVYTNDTLKYVYLKKKDIVRQIVDLGSENENYTIVNKGLAEGDEVIYTEPEKPEDIQTIGWEIYKEQKIRIENEKRKLLESAKKEAVVSNSGTVEEGKATLLTK